MDSLVHYNRLLLRNCCRDAEDIKKTCLGFLQQLEQLDSPRKLRYQEIGECLQNALPVGERSIHTDGQTAQQIQDQ